MRIALSRPLSDAHNKKATLETDVSKSISASKRMKTGYGAPESWPLYGDSI
jgi:hypothetical protein